jgi:thioredoxin 1
MKKIILTAILLVVASTNNSSFAQEQTDKIFEAKIEGMTCKGCAETAKKTLLKVEGIKEATVDFNTKIARVIAEKSITEKQIKETIAGIGYEALFNGEDLVKSLSENEKSKLDITVINGGKKININDHTSAGKINIFDFYADWCGPCKLFSPKAERLLLTYPNLALRKVDVVEWDSEVSKQLTKDYRMPALPFVLIFNDRGKLLGKVTGNHIEKVEEIIKQNLKGY